MSGSLSPAFADAPNRLINPLDVYRQTIEAQKGALDIRAQRIDQANAMISAATRAGASVMQDPSDANINSQFDRLIAFGMPKDEMNTERAAMLSETNPEMRKLRAFQHVNSLQDTAGMLKYGVGETTAKEFGGTSGAQTIVPAQPGLPGGSVTIAPQQVTKTVPPGGWREWSDRDGNLHSGTEADAAEARGRGEMVGPARIVATPPPRATISPPTATAPPTPQPSATPAAPPPAPPKPGTRLGSGAYGGGPAPGAAAAPASSAAAPAAPAPSSDLTLGPSKQLQPDVDAYNEATKTVFPQHQKIIAGESALDALRLVEETGPGTSQVNTAKAFMIAHGIPGYEGLDQPGTEAYQYARKQMLRFAAGNGAKVSTDFAKTIDLESNANVDTLLKGANRHILVQDIGIERQKQAQTLTMPPGGIGQTDFGKGAAEHVKNFPNGTDWHAFAWDIMDPDERRAYMQSIERNPAALAKFNKSKQIAYAKGLWSKQPPAVAPAAPTAPPRPASTPAPPAPNVLIPPGP